MNITQHHAWVLVGKPSERADAVMVELAQAGVAVRRFDHPTLKVDDVRAIIRDSLFTDTARVLLITSLAATREAQNALLKLFEELHTTLTIVWCVPSRGIVLPTILSRVMVDEENGVTEARMVSKEEIKRIIDERDREAALLYVDSALMEARRKERYALVKLLISVRRFLLSPTPLMKPLVELAHIAMASVVKK